MPWSKQPQRIDGHQRSRAGVGEDRRPEPGDADDGYVPKSALEVERDGEVLPDVGHCAL